MKELLETLWRIRLKYLKRSPLTREEIMELNAIEGAYKIAESLQSVMTEMTNHKDYTKLIRDHTTTRLIEQ